MTLREWAFREALAYTDQTGFKGICEIVYERGHCVGCSRWYMYRLRRSRRIMRLTQPGDPASVRYTDPLLLSDLTRRDFRPCA